MKFSLCNIEGCPSGFGQYQRTETVSEEYDGFDSLLAAIEDSNPSADVREVPRGEEPWGRIEGGDYGRIIEIAEGEKVSYCGVEEEESN
jgi:hypothetical protein